MNRLLNLTLLLGCSITLAGCNEKLGLSEDSQATELLGITWMLQSIDIPDSTSIEVEPNKPYNIQFFEDLHLSGINDCNEYFAIYTIIENNSLSLEDLKATRKGCDGESIDQEYLLSLRDVHSYEISDNMLRLYYDDNNSALNYSKTE